MLKSDFFYNLPPELIAQTPLEKRDNSKLLKIDRLTGKITHSFFYNIYDFLNSGDLLVLNDSKVFPARIYGKKRNSEAGVEFLLLEQKNDCIWETLVRPGRRLKVGTVVDFSSELSAEIINKTDGGNRLVKFDYAPYKNIFEILEVMGNVPLPPYIKEKLTDKERYNTVYSKELGSAAAPTAGLHFTPEIFEGLKEKSIDTAFVTLHIGLGTFRPVKTESIYEHTMHKEHFTLSNETAKKINECKKRGNKVIAIGTTSCRVLETLGETLGGNNDYVRSGSGETGIFIYPGYKFKVIDGLLTNFHLPESTLIMLVSAFLGRERTLTAYEEAIKERYRFFSFGDAMFII